MKTFRLEVRSGQDMRHVEADAFTQDDGWMIFFRKPAEGGSLREYWRVQTTEVISMETRP